MTHKRKVGKKLDKASSFALAATKALKKTMRKAGKRDYEFESEK